MWAVPGESRPSPLSAGLAQVRAGISALQEGSHALGDLDCRDGVREVDALLAQLESCWLALVADLDTRPNAVPGVRAGTTALSFLSAGLSRSHAQAKKDVAAAVAPLPLVREAFRSGEITRAHLDVATRCLASIPVRTQEAVDPATGLTGRARIDAYLVEQARQFDPARLSRLAKHLVEVLDDDKDDTFDAEQYLRRELRLREAPDGMTVGKMQLDPSSAVVLRAALEHFTNPQGAGQPAQGEPVQSELPVKDERTKGQRYVDALVQICRLAMDADPATTRREPAHVLVITNPEQLAAAHSRPDAHTLLQQGAQSDPGSGRAFWSASSGSNTKPAEAVGLAEAAGAGPLTPTTLALLTCDAILQPVVLDARTGAILNLGRDQRTASKQQRRALAARDHGCVIPGCAAPPDRCDAHHVIYWSAGGRTDIDDLTLLCEAHHLQVHLGLWKLVMIEGVPHVNPPPWHRLAGNGPIRNRLHDAVDQSRRLAQQLHLDLEPPGDPPDTRAA